MILRAWLEILTGVFASNYQIVMLGILGKLQNKKSFTYMAYVVLKSKLFSAFVLFLSSIIVIRALPKEEYGLYILTLGFFAFFDLLLGGTDASLTRFIPTSGKRVQHHLVATVLSIKTLITLAILTLFVLLYDFSINILNISSNYLFAYENLYLIASLGFISKYVLTSTLTLLNAYMLYDELFKLTVINSLATLIIALFVSFFSLNVWQYVLLTTIFSFIYTIISMVTIYRQKKLSFRIIISSINMKIIKCIFNEKILLYSLPLFGGGLMSYIKNYLPSLMLGVMVSLETLAVYSIFKRLTDFLHKGHAGFIQGLYPRLFKMIHTKSKAIYKLYYIGFVLRVLVFITLYLGYEVILDIYKIQESKYDYLIFLVLVSVFLTMYIGIFFNLIIQSQGNTFAMLKAAFIRTFPIVSIVPLAYFYYDLFGLISAIFISEMGFVLILLIMIKSNYLFKLMLSSYSFLLFLFLFIMLIDSSWIL